MTRLGLAAVALVLAGATVASAAQLPFGNQTVGAGSSSVSRCDTAVTATVTTAANAVTGVTVNDVAAACAGGTLRATLTSDGTPVANLAPVTVPVGGGAVSLAVPAPQPAPSSVTDVRVVVVGP